MPQAVTIASLPRAFELVKSMQGQGLDWGEGYRALGRDALVGILQGQMAQSIDAHLERMAELDQTDRRNGSYRRHLLTELGESELEAAKREVAEETGLTVTVGDLAGNEAKITTAYQRGVAAGAAAGGLVRSGGRLRRWWVDVSRAGGRGGRPPLARRVRQPGAGRRSRAQREVVRPAPAARVTPAGGKTLARGEKSLSRCSFSPSPHRPSPADRGQPMFTWGTGGGSQCASSANLRWPS